MNIDIGIPRSLTAETGMAVMTAENLIQCYENEGKKILESHGCPVDLSELWMNQEKYLPDSANGKGTSPIYAAFWMLWAFMKVREYLKNNDAENSVVWMITALHWAVTLQIKPAEPLFEIAEEVVEGGRHGGKKSGEIRGKKAASIKDVRQSYADKIWRKHPTWSKSDVTRQIQKDHGGEFNTIRQQIQKTPS